MNVAELISSQSKTAFSIEVLPPLKGKGIGKLFSDIEALREFSPLYINITTHQSERVFKETKDGLFLKQEIRRRPGTVAIAAAIAARYGIKVVPHVICSGHSMEDTEYELLDLQYLGITDLLVLRGDKAKEDSVFRPAAGGHSHALDLLDQVQRFNEGIFLDGSRVEKPESPFSCGVACYPEKHEEAANMESDIRVLKLKQDAGAQYAVTQLFFDNDKYFRFVEKARQAGVTIPIIPGIKPFYKLSQLSVLPRTFRVDFPDAFYKEATLLKTDDEARSFGIEWCTAQCKELIQGGVKNIHFYTIGAVESIKAVAKAIY